MRSPWLIQVYPHTPPPTVVLLLYTFHTVGGRASKSIYSTLYPLRVMAAYLLIPIKTRSCLYPMLPFEFGIAVFEDTCFANNGVDVMTHIPYIKKEQRK